jgi:AbrB family looped-hinge helix DNA binding protein
MFTTHLSSKGQIIIPKSVRHSHGWKPGLEFIIIENDEGILIKPAKPFKHTGIKDVLGCTGYKGPRKTLKDMEKAIAKGVRKNK